MSISLHARWALMELEVNKLTRFSFTSTLVLQGHSLRKHRQKHGSTLSLWSILDQFQALYWPPRGLLEPDFLSIRLRRTSERLEY